MLIRSIALFIVGGLNILLGLLVLGRDVKKIANIAFFGMSFFVGLWAIGIGIFLLSSDNSAIWLARGYYAAALLLGLFLAILSLSFPRYPVGLKNMLYLGMPSVVLLSAIMFMPGFLIESANINSWGNDVVINRPHYLIYSSVLFIYFFIGLSRLARKSRMGLGLIRKQTNLLFWACTASASLGIFYNLALPYFGNYRLIWVGPLATSFFFGVVAVSIVRHKMFDIRAVVARALGYSLSLFVLAAFYGFVIFGLLSFLFQQSFSIRFQIIISGTTAVSSLMFPYIRKFFDKQTGRLFFRDQYDSQSLLAEVNSVVISSVDVEVLLGSIQEIISRNMRVEACSFDLFETSYVGRRQIGNFNRYDADKIALVERYLDKNKATVVNTDELGDDEAGLYDVLSALGIGVVSSLKVAVSGVDEHYGLLILGHKKSGTPFSQKDVDVIRILSGELAIAIQNALQYEEIGRFNLTLQQKVDDATRKLRRSNEKLKALDESKDEFISMASHQLRTPLTSVKGYVSMVLEGDVGEINDGQRKMLTQAFVSSQRMASLIADLLNVSRLRTGKFVIEPSAVDLSKLVDDEISQLKETAAGRGLTLEFKKPSSFPMLMLDETKTRQVVMNFVDNAIYYTPSGREIEVLLRSGEKSVDFVVRDNGIGVPKAEQPHLFTKFFRAGNARKARPDGTGLGLFMAKKVIVAQGGAVTFKSTEGKGSEFGFTFPLNKVIAN